MLVLYVVDDCKRGKEEKQKKATKKKVNLIWQEEKVLFLWSHLFFQITKKSSKVIKKKKSSVIQTIYTHRERERLGVFVCNQWSFHFMPLFCVWERCKCIIRYDDAMTSDEKEEKCFFFWRTKGKFVIIQENNITQKFNVSVSIKNKISFSYRHTHTPYSLVHRSYKIIIKF